MKNAKELLQKAGPVRIGMVALCGLVLIFLSCGGEIFSSGSGQEQKSGQGEAAQEVRGDSLALYKEKMEQELRDLLRGVQGVGDVQVMITLRASNEKVTLKDNRSREDTQEEETVLIEDSERNSSPYVIQERQPELEGVVIVCDGGDSTQIKREITEAVGALFQIESHKIKIMKSKEAKE